MPDVLILPVLLADMVEIFGAIFTLGAIILWVIQKIAEANKVVQKPPRQAAPPPRAAAAAGADPAGRQADPLRSQVEEFLRRANQGNPHKQAAPQVRKPAPSAREIELLLEEEPPQPPRRVVGSPMGTMQSRALDREKAGAPSDKRPERRSVIPRKRKSLAERADERAAARTKSMAQQASSLGQRIIAEDQQFDDQLKAKFDHSVGTLASNTVSETELVPVARETPASQIAAMLANPDGVRQAIVLNEVLNRPTDRW